MKKVNECQEWQALKNHYQTIASYQMQTWFDEDPTRFTQFSLKLGDILLDYSKNRITEHTLYLLCQLAKRVGLKEKIAHLFAGRIVNTTENRPALHTALRSTQSSLIINSTDMMPPIRDTLERMRDFSHKIREGIWRGTTGKPMTDMINIGIGGSHLGPLMTTHALADFATPTLRCHFISNIDSTHLNEVLNKIHPETTLFIISSKSFTTVETLCHAETLKQWFLTQCPEADLSAHFIAVTAAIDKAIQFGIAKENIFPLWDWVGGRFSIWSAIGLPLAIMIGMDRFMDFLAGADQMDQHFQQAELNKNMPVILALLSIWYINFFGAAHHAIVPYSHRLNYFRVHLQQVDMESNGKNRSEQGETIDYLTSPVIFGEQGCNGQHAFHQLLHQGPHFIPVDFILTAGENAHLKHHHDILIGSGLSQAKALMRGRTYAEALAECKAEKLSEEESLRLAKHKIIPGNRPSNILFLNRINPFNLGALLALYEHKTFVQGVIWQINSFDQWGVELGKKLLPDILSDLHAQTTSHIHHDSSTLGLIKHYQLLRDNHS